MIAAMSGRADALVARTPTSLDDLAWIGLKLAARSVRVALKAARILATSRELPLALRILLLVGMVQTPLPIDEVALVIALPWLLIWHRAALGTAITEARRLVDAP
jgi:hypothetical protein